MFIVSIKLRKLRDSLLSELRNIIKEIIHDQNTHSILHGNFQFIRCLFDEFSRNELSHFDLHARRRNIMLQSLIELLICRIMILNFLQNLLRVEMILLSQFVGLGKSTLHILVTSLESLIFWNGNHIGIECSNLFKVRLRLSISNESLNSLFPIFVRNVL